MADVIEVKGPDLSVKEPPFVASQSGAVEKAPTANEEEMIRTMFQDAAQRGIDELNTPVSVPAPTVPVPQKFQKPDGTVDEDKLKASSERLNEAVEHKQKTVDQLLAEYQEREKKLHGLSQQKRELEQQMPPAPAPAANPQELEIRLRQDFQRDPLDTTVKLADAIVANKLSPIIERFQQEEENRRLQGLRQNVAELAAQDPRFLDPRLNAMVNQVLDEDPAMMRLKNPHKAAWNEVKERLRLGEANQPPAQPSNSMPTLGRGAPPSVSTLPGPLSPQSASQAVQQVKPYSPEGRELEDKLRDLTRDLWQY